MPAEDELRELTKRHYDKYHFDLFTEAKRKFYLEGNVLINRILKKNNFGGEIVIDVGCGTGSISRLIKEKYDYSIIGIDISINSLKIAKDCLNPINGDNMRLPLKSKIGDFIISNGVIHHTPNPYKSFLELIRIAKPGGILYLAVYKRHSLYYFVYLYWGGICRFLQKTGFNFVLKYLMFPIFCILNYIGTIIATKSIVKPPPNNMCWNIFYDQLLTPQATFHTFKQISGWAENGGIRCVNKQKRAFGQMLEFEFIV